jgi:hypothetical protein
LLDWLVTAESKPTTQIPDRIKEDEIHFGENMKTTRVMQADRIGIHDWIHRPLLLVSLLICSSIAMLAQNANQPNSSAGSFNSRATHLMGFEGAPNNVNGTLSIQENALQFQKDGRPAVQVKIASIQDVLLGEQSRQVGGIPMTLGKAATPFGGGRVVSLFAHKKYDTLAVEYVDASGGLHGAIFQLNKGQAEVLKNELVARGAPVSRSEGVPTNNSTTEVRNENK